MTMVRPELLDLVMLGLRNTLLVVGVSAPAGLLLGFVAGMARVYAPRAVVRLLDLIVDFIRGVPLLAILYILVYGLTDLGIVLNPLHASLIALTLCSAAYISEYVRTSIMSIAAAEIEAARSLGMTRIQELRYIVLPKLRYIATPSVLNELVYLVQYSTLAGLVGVYEIYSALRTYISRYFEVWAPLLLLTAIYIAFTLVAELAGTMVSRTGLFRGSSRIRCSQA
jgi:His/Glu/Gln/Arg/opine family amino acid ABC transporter permease subunit